MRVVDELVSLHYGIDSEVAEYLVEGRVAALWDAYINENRAAVDKAIGGDGGHYFDLIRTRFTSELEAVERLPIPEGWAFSLGGQVVPPNLMQKRTAHAVLTRRRIINTSGVGAGKTLAAILAARVAERRHTLVITNKATVAGWCTEIRRAFPDAVIYSRPSEPVAGRSNFTVLNYERFQISGRNDLVEALAGVGIDFVVLDEVQLVKQRDRKASYRRQAVAALVSMLEEHTEGALHVLGMSATPVLNTLLEGRKLLEVSLTSLLSSLVSTSSGSAQKSKDGDAEFSRAAARSPPGQQMSIGIRKVSVARGKAALGNLMVASEQRLVTIKYDVLTLIAYLSRRALASPLTLWSITLVRM
jgi:hypothetical protein